MSDFSRAIHSIPLGLLLVQLHSLEINGSVKSSEAFEFCTQGVLANPCARSTNPANDILLESWL